MQRGKCCSQFPATEFDILTNVLASASALEDCIHAPNCWTGHGSSQLDRVVLDVFGIAIYGITRHIVSWGR